MATAAPVAAVPEPTPGPSVGKKNGRPAETKTDSTQAKGYAPVYVYTFERPGFQYSSIRIEHDDDGSGKIWFTRDKDEQPFEDPLKLSPGTLATLKKAFDELNFLDSTEDYQFPGHDYSTMGNLTITLTRAGRSRTAKFNWTDNKAAKTLMDTYRGIASEATWKFEMTSARENQPLLTPGLADAIDDYVKRGEIADPPHLVPYLRELSNDERLPLIARNHLTRVADSIAKTKK
ncbi:MAG: hypothetical protein ACJ73D_13750 [Pyrinomonadaceae bacterium]